jgi:hypothetical protein
MYIYVYIYMYIYRAFSLPIVLATKVGHTMTLPEHALPGIHIRLSVYDMVSWTGPIRVMRKYNVYICFYIYIFAFI